MVRTLLELVVVHNEQGHALLLRLELQGLVLLQTLVFLSILIEAIKAVLWHIDQREWKLNL